jgi:hypothetical protein
MDEVKLQERNRINTARRRLSTGLCLGLLTAVAGCGGSAEAPTAAAGGPASSNPKVAQTTWEVAPSRALAVAPGSSFDLADTLPAKVARGGFFEVDPSGAPLPAGVTLDRAGVLSASDSATGGTAGVVFRYTPPA